MINIVLYLYCQQNIKLQISSFRPFQLAITQNPLLIRNEGWLASDSVVCATLPVGIARSVRAAFTQVSAQSFHTFLVVRVHLLQTTPFFSNLLHSGSIRSEDDSSTSSTARALSSTGTGVVSPPVSADKTSCSPPRGPSASLATTFPDQSVSFPVQNPSFSFSLPYRADVISETGFL